MRRFLCSMEMSIRDMLHIAARWVALNSLDSGPWMSIGVLFARGGISFILEAYSEGYNKPVYPRDSPCWT